MAVLGGVEFREVAADDLAFGIPLIRSAPPFQFET